MSTDITIISSMATRQLLDDVVKIWAMRGGCSVHVESVGGVDASKRIMAGERFDVAVLAADAINKLAAADRVIGATVTELARSSVAIAVRRGFSAPSIATEEALRQTVLTARTLGYSTGPSGQALQGLFARWGIVDDIRSRIVQAPPGIPVGELIRRGEVDVGFQQLSELMHLEGIEIIGPMPPGLEIDTIFSGAVCATSGHPDAARGLLELTRSPAADDAMKRNGMQPARPA